jgi:tetratricopeptide (TPR) repeat protein
MSLKVNTITINQRRFSVLLYLLVTACVQLLLGCGRPEWFFGVSGKYYQGWEELVRGRAGNVDKAISSLESVVQENPTYRDSLTLLGKAYYRKGRYQDARLILQRALAVNREDEIAWLVLGLAQIRAGDGPNGLESIRGGITLLGKAMKNGYRGYPTWDPNGTVRSSLRRSALQAMKGLEETDNLIRSTELLLTRIDDEEWAQRRGKILDRATDVGN